MPGPDSTIEAGSRGRSVGARLAVPHTFKPELSFGEALLAISAALARIFGGCLLFALWGGLCAWAWGAIASHFWRLVAVLPLALMFPAVLAGLMTTISAIQRRAGHVR